MMAFTDEERARAPRIEVECLGLSPPRVRMLLEDGSTINLHLVIDRVERLEGLHDDEGQPCYHVTFRQFWVINGAEGLKAPRQ